MEGKLLINQASVDELKRLPGIGARTAESIVAYRRSVGWLTEESFRSIPYIRMSPELLELVDFEIPERFKQQEEILRVAEAADQAEMRRPSPRFRDYRDPDWEVARSEGYAPRASYRPNYWVPEGSAREDYYDRPISGGRSFGQEYARYTPPRRDAYKKEEQATHFWPRNYQDRDVKPEVRQPLCKPERQIRSAETWPVDKSASKRLASIPRTLTYSGKTSWKAFYTKFTKYAESLCWSAKECKEGLCMCLDGKASDFYATNIADQSDSLEYFDIIRKFEKRFGFQELPETATIAFNTAQQKTEEGLDDWADRVTELAMKAYRDLPEEYSEKQAILRFCLGCINKEAGEAVANKRPASMAEAIDCVKWAVHTHTAIHGRSRREIKQVAELPHAAARLMDRDSDLAACSVREGADVRPSVDNLKRTVDGLRTRMDDIEGQNKEITGKLEKILQLLTVRSRSMSPRRPAMSNEAPQRKPVECFNCRGDHFLRDCPNKEKKEERKKVQFVGESGEDDEEDLNEEGLDD